MVKGGIWTWTQPVEEPGQAGGNVEKRKARCIMAASDGNRRARSVVATDNDGRLIRNRADMTASEFVVSRALAPTVPAAESAEDLPLAVRHRLFREPPPEAPVPIRNSTATLGWKDHVREHCGQTFMDCFARARKEESGRAKCEIEVRTR